MLIGQHTLDAFFRRPRGTAEVVREAQMESCARATVEALQSGKRAQREMCSARGWGREGKGTANL